jgi:hypothetical protein
MREGDDARRLVTRGAYRLFLLFTFAGCGSHMCIQIPLQTMNGKYMSRGMVVLSGQTTAAEHARFRAESDAARRLVHKKL